MQKQKLDPIRMREFNRKLVLNIACRQGQIDRKELAIQTGLTAATITHLVKELIEQGLLREIGQGASKGGRRPQLLEINPHAGYLMGVELNTSSIIYILSDLKPNVIEKNSIDIDVHAGKEKILNTVVDTILDVLERKQIPKEKVFGIGFVSAGPYDRENGIMINPPNFPGWQNVPIKDIITQATGIRTLFERESPAAALGEYWFGNNNGYKRLLFINVYEVGLGGGFLIDGDIYHGFCDGSMEIGHVIVQPEGVPCSCGSRGCLEVQADGEAAVRYAREDLCRGRESALSRLDTFTMTDLIACAQAGDPVAQNAVDQCAHYLGESVANMCALLSPDIIYIGGSFCNQCERLFQQAVKIAKNRAYPAHIQDIRVVPSTFGDASGAMGGLAMVYSDLSK